ncbi:MEDS domain-containing protein [Domibacillus sp. A3M-37]|uniref:MEDS domain-containing protein n=1 Tax=Domibacillus sp. A3M-37 TaxID=2962037 RepID=UPI0020B6B67E|nr:MEDS domain-containing protein [Domibacillus sp. A3M-37]MCP3764059.1 MEDS domain-containing protein [Domibacillus sp. A3M-37]
MENEFSKLIKENDSVHIFYSMTELRPYINNLASYILSAIKQGEHVLVIENERVTSLMYKELKNILTKDQLTHIHTINNFDFYFSSGSFHPPAVLDYLSRALKPFYEKKVSFRIWAHAEWSDQGEGLTLLQEYENEANRMIREQGLFVVCAYDEKRMSNSIKTMLMKYHEYILSEDGIIPSDLYQNTKKHADLTSF